MFHKLIATQLSNSLSSLVDSKTLPSDCALASQDIKIDVPKLKAHGDFASNLALLLTKKAKMPPRKLAELLQNSLAGSKWFEKIEIAGPGFLNFFMAEPAYTELLTNLLESRDQIGQTTLENPPQILVEFVSANPTGPLHLGHARGAFLGDCIVRLLRASGAKVQAEFYVNDAGNQVEILGKTLFCRYEQLFGREATLGKDAYPAQYVIDIAQKLKVQDGDKWLDKEESKWLPYFIRYAIKANLADIKETLAKINIHFDSWFLESTLHESKALEQLLKDYESKNMLYQASEASNTEDKKRRKDSKAAQYAHRQVGGTYLKTSDFGDSEDRILMRKDGRPVYLLADLAYHETKFARHFDRIIDVFGADHAGHIPRIKGGMEALGHPEILEFATVQMVRLLKSGKEVRFSKRKGEVELLSDLVDDVGEDAARFVFLMRAANTQFDFDLDTFKKQSSENPVFYLQYGHARCATLLRKAQEQGFGFEPKTVDKATFKTLKLPEEKSLIEMLCAFEAVVASAAKDLEPHQIISYSQDLVGLFHRYFTRYRDQEKIISENTETRQARLTLVFLLKTTLQRAFEMLGISAPEAMYFDKEAP